MDIKRLLIGAAFAVIATTSQAQTNTDVVCSYAPSQSAAVNRIASAAGGAGAGTAAIMQAFGFTVVTHSSGAAILTGAGGYIAGTIGTAVAAPVLITGSVVVGGAAIVLELSCAPINHPNSVTKVKEITAKFNSALRSANDKAVIVRDAAGEKISGINNVAIDVRDGAIKTTNNSIIEFKDGATQFFARSWF